MPPVDPSPLEPTTGQTPRTVRVFHNNNFRDASAFGYQPAPYRFGTQDMPAHTVTEVYRYPAGPDNDVQATERAFTLFNIGDDPYLYNPPDSLGLDYRDRANRGLSVGDLVGIHDERGQRFYACSPAGWDLLDHPPIIDNREQHGTTPVDAPQLAYRIRFTMPTTLAQTDPWHIDACCLGQLLRRVSARLTQHLALDATTSYVFVDTSDDLVWHAKQRRCEDGGFSRSWPDIEIATFTAVPRQ